MPIVAAEEDRMRLTRADNILGSRHRVLHDVGILAAHVCECERGKLFGEIARECGHDGNARSRIKMMLATSKGSAVGICARITPLSAALRSGNSSKLAGTTLKFAAIGVISVPQKPA